jgi:hypothetical protein
MGDDQLCPIQIKRCMVQPMHYLTHEIYIMGDDQFPLCACHLLIKEESPYIWVPKIRTE